MNRVVEKEKSQDNSRIWFKQQEWNCHELPGEGWQWGRILQRNQRFNVGHVKSEIFIRLPSRDGEQACGYLSVEFKERICNWSCDFGNHQCVDGVWRQRTSGSELEKRTGSRIRSSDIPAKGSKTDNQWGREGERERRSEKERGNGEGGRWTDTQKERDPLRPRDKSVWIRGDKISEKQLTLYLKEPLEEEQTKHKIIRGKEKIKG